jgi:hypothetical protein
MFSNEELTIIKMYRDTTSNKQGLLEALKIVLPHFTEDEYEMKEITLSVIRKVTALTDSALEALDLSNAIEVEIDAV